MQQGIRLVQRAADGLPEAVDRAAIERARPVDAGSARRAHVRHGLAAARLHALRQSGVGGRLPGPPPNFQLSAGAQRLAAQLPVGAVLRLDHGHRAPRRDVCRCAQPGNAGLLRPSRPARLDGFHSGRYNNHHGKSLIHRFMWCMHFFANFSIHSIVSIDVHGQSM